MCSHYKFVYEAPNCMTLNQIALNLLCITKLPCESSGFLCYYTALSDNNILMFWDSLLVPPSRVKKSKEQRTTVVH
jgi:hypothetical protein